MRYKNNVLDKLNQTEAIVMRMQMQINRNSSRDEILDTIESLKNSIENVRSMISVEPDDFEQQFAPR